MGSSMDLKVMGEKNSKPGCSSLGLRRNQHKPRWQKQDTTIFERSVSHVNLKVPEKFDEITRPSADITTTASSYFITGDSNPVRRA
jgi:hypothetical protein